MCALLSMKVWGPEDYANDDQGWIVRFIPRVPEGNKKPGVTPVPGPEDEQDRPVGGDQ